MRKDQVTVRERDEILHLLKNGYSLSRVAKLTKRSTGTIYNIKVGQYDNLIVSTASKTEKVVKAVVKYTKNWSLKGKLALIEKLVMALVEPDKDNE